MKNIIIPSSVFSIIFPLGLLCSFIVFLQWDTPEKQISENPESGEFEKHKGVHVFGISDTSRFQSLIRNNLEWVTLVSWGFQDDYDSPNVKHHNGDSSNIRKHNAYWIKQIKLVRDAGFKVFLKPHIWLNSPSDGKWRSDIFQADPESRKAWESSYRDFILRYAMLAEEAGAEMFCIGAEFSKLTIEKPLYWKHLIQEIRAVYSGQITYAANWYQEFEEVTFWDHLDFIGIQAYFPLVKNDYPDVQQLSDGWEKHIPSLESVYKKFDRKIIFTEMGYKSTSDSAIKPWEWLENISNQNRSFSDQTQANCYKAFFDSVWKNDWFAGVHIWQFRIGFLEESEENNMDFTPLGKQAESVIAKGFE